MPVCEVAHKVPIPTKNPLLYIQVQRSPQMDEDVFSILPIDEQLDLDQFIDQGGFFDEPQDWDIDDYRESESYENMSYRHYA